MILNKFFLLTFSLTFTDSYLIPFKRIPGVAPYLGATATGEAVAGTLPDQKEKLFLDELRAYAMKLHTKDQSPKEGQQKASTPVAKWDPKRSDYLKFLVDSKEVYQTMQDISNSKDSLSIFRNTGLERVDALEEDIKWMCEYDPTLIVPEVGIHVREYSKFLKDIADSSIPKYICHYYNHYFAHTAGGRMIGKKMSDLLLEGKVLKFYQVTIPSPIRVIFHGTLEWISIDSSSCVGGN